MFSCKKVGLPLDEIVLGSVILTQKMSTLRGLIDNTPQTLVLHRIKREKKQKYVYYYNTIVDGKQIFLHL